MPFIFAVLVTVLMGCYFLMEGAYLFAAAQAYYVGLAVAAYFLPEDEAGEGILA